MSNRVITMLEGELVRGHGNPYIDGAIRFKELVVNPVHGRFWGLGPAEVARYLQDSTDHFMMALQDATSISIRGPLLASRGFGGDPERIRQARLGDVVEVTDKDKIGPLMRDMSPLALAMQELARRKMSMREAMGSSGQMLPMPSSGARGGATEVSEIVRLASQRGEAMIALIEREDFPHIGRTIHSLLRQFVDPNDELVAVYAGERFSTSLEEIDVDADVRFVGSRQAQSKFQKVSALKEAIATLSTNPEIMQILPDLIVRYFRDGLEIADADDLIVRAQQALAARQAAEAAQAMEAAGGQAVPGSGTESNFGSQAGETERGGVRVA
jgi:hypothetical protein